MRDLIDAGKECLVSSEGDYADKSAALHAVKDTLVPELAKATSYSGSDGCKVVVQAMFESKFLKTGSSDFNVSQIMQYAYGIKLHEALATFHKIFNLLEERGHTSIENKCGTTGDNYYTALKYQVKPTDDDILIRSLHREFFESSVEDSFPTDVYRKVLVIENQSPMYALVLEYSLFSGDPTELHIVRLKENYNDPDRLTHMIEAEFNKVAQLCDGSAYSEKTCRPITTLKISDMECTHVNSPRLIELALINLETGLFHLEDNED
ncbi:hypothetical protein [Neptuniibacter sp. QD37_11]|uniref:hypothetical protein n=1 Tax=Neptuniibacter sp. QD37_11 TaxID=3398209 RepID=UPI0039F633DE